MVEINGKELIYSAVIVLVALLALANLGVISLGKVVVGGKAISNDNARMPEKCKLPAGQDVDSWKEHLRHHAETQDCLQYFP